MGRDFADRPDEDILLERLGDLGPGPTSQDLPEIGPSEPGETAIDYQGLSHYLRGARFAVLALRSRYRNLSEELKEDTKAYVSMLERYADALTAVEQRKT